MKDLRDLTYEEALVLAYTGREPPDPECRGFKWIGQSFASCDGCGKPAWEHEGIARIKQGGGPFGGPDWWYTDPFKPGEADRIRERWSLS